MPAPVSRKQARYMFAILHGDKGGTSSRGDHAPKSVAGKYMSHGSSKDLPESKGKEHEGGNWDEKHHAKDKKRVEEKRHAKRKTKASLRKAFEEFYKGQGSGAVVVNDRGHILIGRDPSTNLWETPGGHVETGESHEDALRRELREESGLTAKLCREIGGGVWEGNTSKVFVVDAFEGKLGAKTDGELKDLAFVPPQNIPWDKMRDCSRQGLELYFNGKLNKSLSDLVALEDLQKNIIRSQVGSDVVHEMSHADAMKLVGNGTFRFLRRVTKDMGDGDFKDVQLDSHKISIRRHASDVYSGRIEDGHKLVHQWTNRSLPAMAAELMSVFEWYSPEDEKFLEEIDEGDLPDDAIEGGLQNLIDHYKKHNVGNIYSEMETIRTEIRNGVAVDLQQVETRIMKLFDRLETSLMQVVDKHNDLGSKAGNDIDELHAKLKDLQDKIETLGKKPSKIEAFSTAPADPKVVHEDGYMYLPRPQVTIHPDGRITIGFAEQWSPMEKQNFLADMRAKVINKKK